MAPKKKTVPETQVQQKHTYYVVAVESPKKTTGIIGALDIYVTHILLENGTTPPQELCQPGVDPIAWYRSHLETQDIYTCGGAAFDDGTSAGASIIYVDTAKTNVDEFMNVRGLSPAELEGSMAWRSFIIPCHAGTTKEALGFWVCAQKEMIGTQPLSALLTNALALAANSATRPADI
jgi:hypothetical protein